MISVTSSADDGQGIAYVVGDVTRPIVGSPTSPQVVAHACNDGGGWGAGVSGAVGRRWPKAERAYREAWHRGVLRPGASQLVEVTQVTYVANLIACHVVHRGPGGWRTRINFTWLHDALTQLANQTRDTALGRLATVHMPRIGCGLARGEWADVESLIRGTLVAAGVLVYVYDLPAARDLQQLRCAVRRELG